MTNAYTKLLQRGNLNDIVFRAAALINRYHEIFREFEISKADLHQLEGSRQTMMLELDFLETKLNNIERKLEK